VASDLVILLLAPEFSNAFQIFLKVVVENQAARNISGNCQLLIHFCNWLNIAVNDFIKERDLRKYFIMKSFTLPLFFSLLLAMLMTTISFAQVAGIGVPATGTYYPSVTVGCQTWMSKNLDVAKYRNGDPIPQVTDKAAWRALTTGAWCYYNNDPAMGAIYGKLYNWYAVNDPRGLAPAGWHIPIDFEWKLLSKCLGGDAAAVAALKETGTAHWVPTNAGTTNSTGFTALPGGYRNIGGTFYRIGEGGYFWTATSAADVSRPTFAWLRYLSYINSTPNHRTNNQMQDGYSVRCVKD
jgi:uncharacterized protein (TIGR02145 family)